MVSSPLYKYILEDKKTSVMYRNIADDIDVLNIRNCDINIELDAVCEQLMKNKVDADIRGDSDESETALKNYRIAIKLLMYSKRVSIIVDMIEELKKKNQT